MDFVTKIGPGGNAVLVDTDTGGANKKKGSVTACVCTLGVPDLDGDIIDRSAVPNGAIVVISDFAHSSMQTTPPVGMGRLFVEGNSVILRGRYWIDTDHGRHAFEVMKRMGAAAQWSWAFLITKRAEPSEEQRTAGARKVILGTDPVEASVVLRGAGRNTRTIDAKRTEREQANAQRLVEQVRANLLRYGPLTTPRWRFESDDEYLRRIRAAS